MKSRIIAIAILLLVIFNIVHVNNTLAISKTEYVTIKNFVERTVNTTGIGKTYNDAINAGIVLEGEFSDTGDNITNEDAALILDRTWNVLYGDTDNNTIKTKEWFLRPYFVIQVKSKELSKTEVIENKMYTISIDDIKAKQEELLNKFKEKYNQYTFVSLKDFTVKGKTPNGEYKTDTTVFNVDNEDTVFIYESDRESIFCLKFYIKDKCYHNNEFNKMLKDIETTYNATFDVENPEYYSINLTNGIMKERIKESNRISDVKKAKANNMEAIYSMYSKGVMIGYYNGYYVTNRSFRPTAKSSLSEAKVWISRIAGEKTLRAFSPEGMLVRVTNLPFNANEWKYILEDIPNDFYLMRYDYEVFGGYDNLNTIRKEAILPVNFCDTYHQWTGIEGNRLNTIIESVNENLKLQLNVSYKTIDNEWANAFYQSVSDHLSLIDMSITKEYADEKGNVTKTITNNSRSVFEYYIEYVKKHKVTIKSDKIYVDPNSIYLGDKKAFIRCYVKFKIYWTGKLDDVNTLVFPGDYYSNNLDLNYLTGLKKGKYIECMVDVPIDLHAPYKYEQCPIYGGIHVGYLKSMKYLKTPNDYDIVYIKTRQLKIKRTKTAGGGKKWEWE